MGRGHIFPKNLLQVKLTCSQEQKQLVNKKLDSDKKLQNAA